MTKFEIINQKPSKNLRKTRFLPPPGFPGQKNFLLVPSFQNMYGLFAVIQKELA